MKMDEQKPFNVRVGNALKGLEFVMPRLEKMHKEFYKKVSAKILEDYIKKVGMDKANLPMKDDPFFLYCIFLAGAAMGCDHIDDGKFTEILSDAVGFARELKKAISAQNMTMN
jgi:hypothetical protein